MIRIMRPEQAPDVLLNAGEQETRLNCENYDLNSAAYRCEKKPFEFQRNIYAHKTVKNALLRAQHKKCCYCESKFRATSPGAVEHFRPKGAVQQAPRKGMLYPGYYWLAYSWNNLLVSCETCNSSYKRSLFPLADEKTRARSHHDDTETETPIFIDPASDDPRQHIRFRGAEIGHRTDRGLRTIKTLGLARDDLEDARAEVLERLEVLYFVIEDLKDVVQSPKVERARRLLNKATRREAEFSAMVRDFLGPRGFEFEGA